MSRYYRLSLLEKAPPQVHEGAIKEGVHGRDVAVGKLHEQAVLVVTQAGIFDSAAS